MKVGDMVTLSAAALKRDPMFQWKAGYKPKPIGFVVEVKNHARIGWVSKYQPVYVIRWITVDAPKSRQGQHGYMASRFVNQFYRADLKYKRKHR